MLKSEYRIVASSIRYILFRLHTKRFFDTYIQGPPLGIDIMYLVLADRNMQVRFGLKVVWES